MQYILDASFFFAENHLEGDLWTTAEVAEEIRDHVSKMRFEVLTAEGLKIGGAGPAEVSAVKEAAEKSGDLRVLS
ncbi:nucleotide-binding protein, partial [Methanocorpusculaceae archaeon]|nr:nucleotide-binding protein [Methanocorpusculaceae archaeon]